MIGVGALGPGELALVHFTAVAAELVGLAVTLKKERHNSQRIAPGPRSHLQELEKQGVGEMC